MVAEQKRMGCEKDLAGRDKMEAQIQIPQQRSAMGHSDVEVGGRREGLVQLMAEGPLHKKGVIVSLLNFERQPTEKKPQKGEGAQEKKPRDLEP